MSQAPPHALPGLPPPPLPDLGPALASLREDLVEIEQMAIDRPRDAASRRATLEARALPAALALRLLEALPPSLGDVPETLPSGRRGAARRALEAEWRQRLHARLAREETLALLHAIAAADLAFQARAWERLGEVEPPALRLSLRAALCRAPRLCPAAEGWARAVAVASPATQESRAAVEAAWRQGWAEELLWPCVLEGRQAEGGGLARLIVELGGRGHMAADPERWVPRLEELARVLDQPFDWSGGDTARAQWQVGLAAREALVALRPPPPPQPSPPPAPPRPAQARRRSPEAFPTDRRRLRSRRGREAALDALASWFVEGLATANDEAAMQIIEEAIEAFYDIREAAGQPRGMYAGHFYMVDGVGLENTGRPVPWVELRARVGPERCEALAELYRRVEEGPR